MGKGRHFPELRIAVCVLTTFFFLDESSYLKKKTPKQNKCVSGMSNENLEMRVLCPMNALKIKV